ncbi:MAG TPA: cyclic nucleotide-binding domain-containing protein, partial [Spirochaetota bacterium]|nr:cyclic nucleotide-binding domain-containing protein [Spirochaetota bacterium]
MINDITTLKQNILFKNCSLDDLKFFNKYLEPVFYRKDSIIYEENSQVKYVYLIINGKIELNLSLDFEKTHTICHLSKNNIFGIG